MITALLLAATLAAADAPVRIFVTSAGASQGFTDPSKDNRDSVADLREAFKKSKSVVITESAEDADIILTVLKREKGALKRDRVFGDIDSDLMLHVTMRVGESESELTGIVGPSDFKGARTWKETANKIAKQVNEWIATNRTKLHTR